MSIKELVPWAWGNQNSSLQKGSDYPFYTMNQWLDDMFREFHPSRQAATTGLTTTPRLDVKEGEKEFTITAELPGVEEKDIDISVSDGVLTLKGEKNEEKEEKTETYHRTERSYGTFFRSISLPQEVDEDGIEAGFKNGVLSIKIPKTPAAEPKKIKVKALK